MRQNMPNFRATMFHNPSYLPFMQAGGVQVSPEEIPEQPMEQQEMMPEQQAPQQGGEMEQVVSQFLQAFQQLPPEAQQMIVQAITQG
jgi:hypothetical protein